MSMSNNESERVTLCFDLFDLPTTQHKAGLAGLLLQIQSMKERRIDADRIPGVEELTRTSARITFTLESTLSLFNDLYCSTKAIRLEKKLRKDKRTKQVVPPDGDPVSATIRGKLETKYPYLVTRPKPQVLLHHLSDSSEENLWVQLWRDMVWSIPRGGNNVKARSPFDQCAERGCCSSGADVWRDILSFKKSLKKGYMNSKPLSGALLLAAQQKNAEAVPFSGRIDHNILLHFWQVVVLTYVPQHVKRDSTKRDPAQAYRLEPHGFVLALPDVADLREFTETFPEVIGTLDQSPRNTRHGQRPAAALIDVPFQAGLEFLRCLRNLATTKADRELQCSFVTAIESYHMLGELKKTSLLCLDRTLNRGGIVAKYERIRNAFRNPLFRAAQLRSLVRDQPWYCGMLELFADRPWTFFVEHERTPRFIPRFGTDARTQFRAIFQDTQDMKNDEMSDSDRLGRIVQRLVNKYVEGRAEAKTGKKVKAFPKETVNGRERRIYPNEFREAQQRVCSDIFLSMRSRHDQDFVESFVGSICSVAQYLPSDDYQFLTSVLMRQSQKDATGPVLPCWEDVKALAMIAVSACSYATQPRESSTQQAKENAT